MKNEAYYIARYNAIKNLVNVMPVGRDKRLSDRDYLLVGFVPESFKNTLETEIKNILPQHQSEKLSFEQLTSFSTWFAMHPEKVCGEEVATTSYFFPVKIKGNRADVERVIERELRNTTNTEALNLRERESKSRKRRIEILALKYKYQK